MTRTIKTLAFVAVLAAAAPHTLGQAGLPAAVVNAPGVLTAEQREMVKAHVAKYAGDLSNEKVDTIQKARSELLIPLQEADVGVSFRNAYAEDLVPLLQPLVSDKRDAVAVNALRVAGNLAHNRAGPILDAGMKSQVIAVRYAAVAGAGDTFDALARTAPAIDVGAARGLIRKLGPIVKAETDAMVFDAGVRALVSASTVDREGWGTLRDDAINELASVMSDRFQKLAKKPAEPAMMQAVIRGIGAGRDAVAAVAVGGRRLGPDAQKKAAEMSGDALAYVRALVQAQTFPVIQAADEQPTQDAKTAARIAPADLASVAVATISLSNDALGGGSLPQNQLQIGQLLRSAKPQDDARFLEGARELFGSLSKPPFAFAADRFTK